MTPFYRTWLEQNRIESDLLVRKISFSASKEWLRDTDGNLVHRTGRFFKVVGVNFYSPCENGFKSQPIIDQSEIGLLALITHRERGVWSVLVQAKVEPGNCGEVQLAPTVQATKSNYESAHGGSEVPYLDTVQSSSRVLCNQLQSEQNSRFLAKRNRNYVVLVEQKLSELKNCFKWIPMHQFLPMLGSSHRVNTDARSVLSCWLFTDIDVLKECLPAHSGFTKILLDSLSSRQSFHSDELLDQWRKKLDSLWPKKTEVISLADLGNCWNDTSTEISCMAEPTLIVQQISVKCKTREVKQWDQPVISAKLPSTQTLIMAPHKGALHLLLQARLEAGNRYSFELTTTVQNDGTKFTEDEKTYFELAGNSGRCLASIDNSDEGGRFDQCISRYDVFLLKEASEVPESNFHRWVSLSQVAGFLRREDSLTNELRSSLSTLLSIRELA